MNLAQKLAGEKILTKQPAGQQRLGSTVKQVVKKQKVKHAKD